MYRIVILRNLHFIMETLSTYSPASHIYNQTGTSRNSCKYMYPNTKMQASQEFRRFINNYNAIPKFLVPEVKLFFFFHFWKIDFICIFSFSVVILFHKLHCCCWELSSLVVSLSADVAFLTECFYFLFFLFLTF